MYHLLYTTGEDSFVRITKTLKAGSTKDINKATTFRDLSAAKSWFSLIKAKFPKAELREAGLILIKK
jgi:hypothetical protein